MKLAVAFNYASLDFAPQTASPLLSGAIFTKSILSYAAAGFYTTTYRGAVGAAGTPEGDWGKGWSKII